MRAGTRQQQAAAAWLRPPLPGSSLILPSTAPLQRCLSSSSSSASSASKLLLWQVNRSHQAACLAERALVGDAQARVEHAVGLRPPLRHLRAAAQRVSRAWRGIGRDAATAAGTRPQRHAHLTQGIGLAAAWRRPAATAGRRACMHALHACMRRLQAQAAPHLVQRALKHVELCSVHNLCGAHHPELELLAARRAAGGVGSGRASAGGGGSGGGGGGAARGACRAPPRRSHLPWHIGLLVGVLAAHQGRLLGLFFAGRPRGGGWLASRRLSRHGVCRRVAIRAVPVRRAPQRGPGVRLAVRGLAPPWARKRDVAISCNAIGVRWLRSGHLLPGLAGGRPTAAKAPPADLGLQRPAPGIGRPAPDRSARPARPARTTDWSASPLGEQRALTVTPRSIGDGHNQRRGASSPHQPTRRWRRRQAAGGGQGAARPAHHDGAHAHRAVARAVGRHDIHVCGRGGAAGLQDLGGGARAAGACAVGLQAAGQLVLNPALLLPCRPFHALLARCMPFTSTTNTAPPLCAAGGQRTRARQA